MTFALRSPLRQPLYAALVVLTMALGSGAVIALCAVVDGPFFRPLPFPEGERLIVAQGVRLQTNVAAGRLPAPFYQAVARHRGLELVSFAQRLSLLALFGEEAEQWNGASVSANMLGLLGVRPMHGRLLRAEDYDESPDMPVLISAALWERRFGRDPDILGRSIQSERQVLRVVGIYDAGTLVPIFPRPIWPDFIAPARMTSAQMLEDEIPAPVARLRQGVSFEAAKAEMSTQLGPVADRYPQLFDIAGMRMRTLRDYMYAEQRDLHALLSWAAGLMLLALCVNTANLQFVRLRAKQQDVAVQRALGAGKGRILAEIVIQNVTLALCAWPPGLALASLICYYLRREAPDAMAVFVAPTIDARTWAIGLFVCVSVALVTAAVAAPQALRLADKEPLRSTRSHGSGPHKWQSVLTALQVSMVLALLIGASLMVHSLARLVSLPVGATVKGVLVFSPRLPYVRYSGAEAKRFWHRLEQEIGDHPEVLSAAVGYSLPMLDRDRWATLATRDASDAETSGAMVPISSQYFETLGLPLREGRTFSIQEDISSAPVGVVNEAAARAYWPDGNAVGRTMFTPWFTVPYTVIGVVADTRFTPDVANVPTMYVPVWTYKALPLHLVVRVREDSPALRTWIASKIRQLERDAVVPPARTYASLLEHWRHRPQFIASLLVIFAAMVLTVTAVGTAALVGYGVRLRYRELGIRLALGANQHTIRLLVLRDTLMATTFGVVAGIGLGMAFGRLLQHELFEIPVADPLTYGAAVLLLLMVVVGAGLVPARLASRIDPSITLRQE